MEVCDVFEIFIKNDFRQAILFGVFFDESRYFATAHFGARAISAVPISNVN